MYTGSQVHSTQYYYKWSRNTIYLVKKRENYGKWLWKSLLKLLSDVETLHHWNGTRFLIYSAVLHLYMITSRTRFNGKSTMTSDVFQKYPEGNSHRFFFISSTWDEFKNETNKDILQT